MGQAFIVRRGGTSNWKGIKEVSATQGRQEYIQESYTPPPESGSEDTIYYDRYGRLFSLDLFPDRETLYTMIAHFKDQNNNIIPAYLLIYHTADDEFVIKDSKIYELVEGTSLGVRWGIWTDSEGDAPEDIAIISGGESYTAHSDIMGWILEKCIVYEYK